MDSSVPSETIILSYPAAGYVCGLSYSYQLFGDSELLLRTASGQLVWVVEGGEGGVEGEWIHASSFELSGGGQWYLTEYLDDVLQFVLVSHGDVGGGASTVEVVLDNVEVEFCLPCNFEELKGEG